MALTGKTIGELEYLQFPTNDTLIPVQYVGDTYHITFSSITYNEGTYAQFVAEAGAGVLTPGRFYLMTDYQAIYDQPNYDNFKTPIFTGNSMTGITEPLLLLAISETQFSPTVYSTLYPQDQITYDITWNTTEISNTPAKGRITERIDIYNNRTDYDHRNILFKRYRAYSYDLNNPLNGLVGISGITGTTGVLYGNTGTTFTSFFIGQVIAIRNLYPQFFQVISVEDDFNAIISGVTISETNDSSYYYGNDDGIMSYYKPNIEDENVYEYTTFGDAIDDNGAVNNYVGNYSNLYLYEGVGNFLLANNVFLVGAYRNNTIGDGSRNNTFNDDCYDNQIGSNFYNNSTNDDFDSNIIGDNFRDNFITANFQRNRIGYNFYDNILTGSDFYRNNIGNDFNGNVCNTNDFQNNEIGNQFNNNEIYNNFYKNDIGNGYNGNNIYSEFYGNLITNGFNNNNIYASFRDNVIGDYFDNNTIGDSVNIGFYSYFLNRIGYFFQSNIILGTFAYNEIGNYFYNNNIGDGFGFGASTSQGNKIGNYFHNNIIGEYFYNNVIADGFYFNTIVDFFQLNDVKFSLFSTDFSSATYVYGDYNCTLFKNSVLSPRLSYFDGSDTLTVVNVTD